MKLADLTPETLEKVKTWRWDRIIEKHEGPWGWDMVMAYYDVEFLRVEGRDVLLPVDKDQHKNITILRCIVGDDGESLTIFLKDTTHVEQPDDEQFFSGFVAVCDRMPGEDFYVTILYHEWFIIDKQA
ncbi:MAG TPA: hypothetical protein VHB98_04025 [Chloroflexota bacterium]|nr:hypothetical protein [Chloroflexota bacterium]